MKTLILIRHAHALPGYIARVSSDALRPLAEEGVQKARQTAGHLAHLGVKPELILSSPLLRAVQTADILAKTLAAPVEKASELNGLAPDEDVAAFLRTRLAEVNTLAAVSHNPSITCVHQLLCGQLKVFAPGSFAVLQLDANGNARLTDFGE